MDFTREPITETVITSKEGSKLVVRNSKGAGQEEYFVDAVEIVSFGHATFFRSLERPKSFLVPVSDYEVFEVRDARVMLKNVNIEKVKIGGGRDSNVKAQMEQSQSSNSKDSNKDPKGKQAQPATSTSQSSNTQDPKDPKAEKKRERRRNNRRKRGGKDEPQKKEESDSVESEPSSEKPEKPEKPEQAVVKRPRSILAPPSTLISDKIDQYKQYEKEPSKETPPKESPVDKTPSKKREVEGDDSSFFREQTEGTRSMGEEPVQGEKVEVAPVIPYLFESQETQEKSKVLEGDQAQKETES